MRVNAHCFRFQSIEHFFPPLPSSSRQAGVKKKLVWNAATVGRTILLGHTVCFSHDAVQAVCVAGSTMTTRDGFHRFFRAVFVGDRGQLETIRGAIYCHEMFARSNVRIDGISRDGCLD